VPGSRLLSIPKTPVILRAPANEEAALPNRAFDPGPVPYYVPIFR